MRTAASLVFCLVWPAGAALAAGAITDQAVTLTYPFGHWDGTPAANLVGTELTAGQDVLVQSGWWYRVEGDTREYPLPEPDSEVYADGKLTATWNNLDNKGFLVVESTYVLDGEGPSGGTLTFMTATNNALVTRYLTLFHYLDLELGGTPGNDTALQESSLAFKFADELDPAARARLRVRGTSQLLYRFAPAGEVRDLLNDADVDDLDSTGLPFPAGDVSVGFQFGDYFTAGETARLAAVSLLSRQPGAHVKGAFDDLTPWAALLTRDPVTNTYATRALRRTTALSDVVHDVPVPGPDWRVVGVDDFHATLRNSYVQRNLVTGATTVGNDVITGAPAPPPNWTLSATGDWNSDRRADLLWRNTTSQKLVIWFMNGSAKIGAATPTPDQAVSANWEVAGGGDFDGDGFRDFLWYNQTSGNLVIWYMDDELVRITGAFTTPSSVGNANWKVGAVADLGKGEGVDFPAVWNTADIVWQNATSKKVVVWHMDLQGRRTSGLFTSPDQFGGAELVAGPR